MKCMFCVPYFSFKPTMNTGSNHFKSYLTNALNVSFCTSVINEFFSLYLNTHIVYFVTDNLNFTIVRCVQLC